MPDGTVVPHQEQPNYRKVNDTMCKIKLAVIGFIVVSMIVVGVAHLMMTWKVFLDTLTKYRLSTNSDRRHFPSYTSMQGDEYESTGTENPKIAGPQTLT